MESKGRLDAESHAARAQIVSATSGLKVHAKAQRKTQRRGQMVRARLSFAPLRGISVLNARYRVRSPHVICQNRLNSKGMVLAKCPAGGLRHMKLAYS